MINMVRLTGRLLLYPPYKRINQSEGIIEIAEAMYEVQTYINLFTFSVNIHIIRSNPLPY